MKEKDGNIIPKEGSKQEEIDFIFKELTFEKERSLKQETLEEAAERLLNLNELDKFRDLHYIQELQDSFKLGAKWQAERSYSEEEVVSFIHKFLKEHQPQLPYLIGGINMWFEHFKKK